MEQRALLAVILSILVLFLWQAYIVKGRRPQPAGPQAPAGEKITSPQAAPLPLREPAQEARIAPPERKPETFIEEEITVNTPLYLARFSTAGGRLKSMRLKAFRE